MKYFLFLVKIRFKQGPIKTIWNQKQIKLEKNRSVWKLKRLKMPLLGLK